MNQDTIKQAKKIIGDINSYGYVPEDMFDEIFDVMEELVEATTDHEKLRAQLKAAEERVAEYRDVLTQTYIDVSELDPTADSAQTRKVIAIMHKIKGFLRGECNVESD